MQLQFSALRPSFSLCSCTCPIFLGFFSLCICSLQEFGNDVFYAAAVLEVSPPSEAVDVEGSANAEASNQGHLLPAIEEANSHQRYGLASLEREFA